MQSILVLGGMSDIAQATLRKLTSPETRNIALACRNPAAAADHISELKALGAQNVRAVEFQATDFASHAAFVEQQFELVGKFDLVLLAFATLGDQDNDERVPLDAANVIETNFTGAASVLLSVAHKLKQQGSGTIIVLSTVAAERARAANFIYGSSKAGLDAFCQGLADSLVGTGVHLAIVRPGFVTTKMTAGKKRKPLATDANAVADIVVKAIADKANIVWAPRKLRYIFILLRHLPRPLWRKIKS